MANNLKLNKLSQEETFFCGIDILHLTNTQQELFVKLNPEQRQELSQKTVINTNKWQIEFIQIKRAIKDNDIIQTVNKEWANDTVKRLWNEWFLPQDIDFSEENNHILDPKSSDYDAMIMQMPGMNDNEKVQNFRLLTGMQWWYWTSRMHSTSNTKFVVHAFGKYVRDRSRLSDFNDTYNVRPIKLLP